jgi:hypothetical protein
MYGALILLLSFTSCAVAQSTQAPAQPSTPPATTPTVANPQRPQEQMPPDKPAPPPRPGEADQATQSNAKIDTEVNRHLAGGTNIRATLDTPLSTKTAKVGDRFTATVAQPVHDASGAIVVPVGAKVNGQISETENTNLASAIKGMGHLDLRFTDIQLPDGTDLPLSATLLSVHNTNAPRPAKPDPLAAVAVNSTGFGRPIKGLAVGNVAGGGYVLATNGKQVDLPAETGLLLRVDRDTPLPGSAH